MLASHFKVQSIFFYVVGKAVRRTTLYGDRSCSSFDKKLFKKVTDLLLYPIQITVIYICVCMLFM